MPDTAEDMFCSGHNQLPDGNILFSGGTHTYNNRSANGKWLGLNGSWKYDVASNTMTPTASRILHGRWYPTHVTLPDGKVLVVGGYDEYGAINRLAEIFDPATETWSIKYDPNSTATYCAGQGEDPEIMPGAGQTCYGPGVGPNVILYPRLHLMPNCRSLRTIEDYEDVRTFDWHMEAWGKHALYGNEGLWQLRYASATEYS